MKTGFKVKTFYSSDDNEPIANRLKNLDDLVNEFIQEQQEEKTANYLSLKGQRNNTEHVANWLVKIQSASDTFIDNPLGNVISRVIVYYLDDSQT